MKTSVFAVDEKENFLQEDKFTYESACYINCCLRRQLDPQTRPQREVKMKMRRAALSHIFLTSITRRLL
ncbi:hypothetical protein CapIbe_017838 [Capra ibex]